MTNERINKRLSNISSNATEFKKAAPVYQEALNESGYKYKLNYNPTENQTKRNRDRKITWFNPPFDLTVKTNVGKKFLAILKSSFTATNPLHKIFNKNTVKLSYSCMPNLKTIINNHNKKNNTNRDDPPPERQCNCRQKNNCPLQGHCLAKSIIYQAKVRKKTQKPM